MIPFVHTLTRISHQTLWTSSEAEPTSEAAPAEKKEEAPAAEAEKPAAE